MKLQTAFIRAAVAGVTADSREITAEQIDQMAASYSPDTYEAGISLEHLYGVLPDGAFKSLGRVVEVMADTIKTGALKGKRALYVKLEPHQNLINMVRDGQKTHLSIEMLKNFADTGRAYLIGVGVTDQPASLGTGMMQFSAQKRADSTFSEPMESHIDLPDVPAESDSQAAVFKVALDELRTQRDEYKAELTTAKDRVQALETEVDELKGQLPAHGYVHIPLSGGSGAKSNQAPKSRF